MSMVGPPRKCAPRWSCRVVTSEFCSTVPAHTSGQLWKGISMAESGKHLSCQEVVELVTDYLEGTLGPQETTLFEQHLNFCDGCIWYLEQMRTTVATVGRIREED